MKTLVSTPISVMGMVLLGLAGCHQKSATTAAKTATSPVIVVSQARFVLPAVKGNPGAAYFTLGNEHSAPLTLVSVDVAGAKKTEMHETSGGTMGPLAQVRIDPGQRVIFAPGGKHVMAFGLNPSLAQSPGGTSEIVFHFQDGRTMSAPLRVESAGGGAMDHSVMHMDGHMDGKP
jgi:copper(I)-binding protein